MRGRVWVHAALNRRANYVQLTTGRVDPATHPRTLVNRHLPTTMGYMPFFLSAHCATHLPPRTRPHRQARGFTLLEVMVVAIIAVLAAIAAPSFTPLIELLARATSGGRTAIHTVLRAF